MKLASSGWYDSHGWIISPLCPPPLGSGSPGWMPLSLLPWLLFSYAHCTHCQVATGNLTHVSWLSHFVFLVVQDAFWWILTCKTKHFTIHVYSHVSIYMSLPQTFVFQPSSSFPFRSLTRESSWCKCIHLKPLLTYKGDDKVPCLQFHLLERYFPSTAPFKATPPIFSLYPYIYPFHPKSNSTLFFVLQLVLWEPPYVHRCEMRKGCWCIIEGAKDKGLGLPVHTIFSWSLVLCNFDHAYIIYISWWTTLWPIQLHDLEGSTEPK